ncbi:MAG TPA: uroporphyrinogen-III C-methyltransferase [Sneathiellales bacterium]|nr:uroporphyrinogen-III C-methyltransferase [Sneathiellales bacterium]
MSCTLEELPFNLPLFEFGWVWLAGAGPGDPGLITLQTLNGLRNADVIVYDALVNPQILELAKKDAQLEFAGKRGGRPSAKQPDISSRLVALAKQGLRVLRLKGGDPFIFGRGAEEAAILAEAGVPFRILPGVTAGIGGLAYAGIPATARDINSAVTFITGHSATGEMPESLDWKSLARGSPVLVIYMGLKHLTNISARLIEVGRDPTEAVAIISQATLPEQTVLETTLADCAREAERHRVQPPTLIVVGQVVELRAGLKWPFQSE